MINVAIISPYPPSKDGIAEYTRKFVKYADLNDSVSINTIISKKYKTFLDIRQHSILSNNPLSWVKAYKIIRNSNPSIIHLQFDVSNYMLQIPYLFFLLAIIKLTTTIKIIVTHHEAYRDQQLYGFVAVAFYSIFNKLFDRIYVHTALSLSCVVDAYHTPLYKVLIIPHGLNDFTSFKRNHKVLRQRYEIPDNRKILLNFGFIYKTKGLQFLIEAMNIIHVSGVTLPYLIIAGTIPKRSGVYRYFQKRNEKYQVSLIEQIKYYGLEKSIKFIGYVNSKEIYSLFTLSTMVVLPYTRVDQSGVLNYAIAANTPVIASNVGGIGETLQNEGLLVTPSNSNELAMAISMLLENPSKLLDIKNGYKKLEILFSTKTAINTVIKDYEFLMNQDIGKK